MVQQRNFGWQLHFVTRWPPDCKTLRRRSPRSVMEAKAKDGVSSTSRKPKLHTNHIFAFKKSFIFQFTLFFPNRGKAIMKNLITSSFKRFIAVFKCIRKVVAREHRLRQEAVARAPHLGYHESHRRSRGAGDGAGHHGGGAVPKKKRRWREMRNRRCRNFTKFDKIC